MENNTTVMTGQSDEKEQTILLLMGAGRDFSSSSDPERSALGIVLMVAALAYELGSIGELAEFCREHVKYHASLEFKEEREAGNDGSL